MSLVREDGQPCRACGAWCDGDVCDAICAGVLELRTRRTTRYTFTVYIDSPHDSDGDPAYTGKEMEKHLVQVLRRIDGDTDCELMDTEVIDDGG